MIILQDIIDKALGHSFYGYFVGVGKKMESQEPELNYNLAYDL
jgi:hypothetical protein